MTAVVEIALAALVRNAFVVTGWVGSPRNAAPDEHDALGWFAASDLPGLRLAHPAYRTPSSNNSSSKVALIWARHSGRSHEQRGPRTQALRHDAA